jgi:hypothetical protein
VFVFVSERTNKRHHHHRIRLARRETFTAYFILLDIVVLRLRADSCWAFLVEGDAKC